MWGNRVWAAPIRGEVPPYNLRDQAFPGQINPDWASLPGLQGDPTLAWMRGVQWTPTGCVEAHAWDPNCANWPKGNKSTPPEIQGRYQTDPFVIETAYSCLMTGSTIGDDLRAIALEQLELATPKALEYQFWTNTLGSRMQSLDSTATEITGLTSDATIITGSGGFDRQVGLALAGQALANCGAGTQGMIHAPAWIVELWFGDGLVTEEDGHLVTGVRKDRVVAGSGYPGTGPGGAAVSGTFSWIYATGPVEVYLGDADIIGEQISESLDRRTNTAEFRAERAALVRFDPCCHAAVLIDGAANGGG
jgi:hypothetical protein